MFPRFSKANLYCFRTFQMALNAILNTVTSTTTKKSKFIYCLRKALIYINNSDPRSIRLVTNRPISFATNRL